MPVTDPLTRPGSELVDMVLKAFPALGRTRMDDAVSGAR